MSDELYEMCDECEGKGFAADRAGYAVTCPDCGGSGSVKVSAAKLHAELVQSRQENDMLFDRIADLEADNARLKAWQRDAIAAQQMARGEAACDG